MIIYICCSGGATSSLLCEKIKKAGSDKFTIYFDPIEYIIIGSKLNELPDADIILAYGGSASIKSSFVSENNLDKFIDLILVSPQVRYDIKRIDSVMKPYNIPVEGIDMKTFGTMDGSKMLDRILEYKSMKGR